MGSQKQIFVLDYLHKATQKSKKAFENVKPTTQWEKKIR
jgi:hypothetical protein